MSLKSINPTETKSWSKLKDHFNDIKETHISDYFISNSDRYNQLSIISVKTKKNFLQVL